MGEDLKNIFQGFYRPNDRDFEVIWNECVFALDANVLLNLYRYPEKAREELLAALSSVSDRILVPFQAALEYQRNRPKIIAEQKGRFQDVRSVVEKLIPGLEGEFGRLQLRDRHALIDPDRLIRAIKPAISEFLVELSGLEKKQSDVQDEDPLRDKIGELIGANVTAAPTQEEIDAIRADGKIRFDAMIPPGYMDSKKEGDGAIYTYGGVRYDAKFGDLVLWMQLLHAVNERKAKSAVFLTDDEKEDWWWLVDSRGRKKLGPRPELVEEMQRVGGAAHFYIYNSEQFLKYARQYLDVKVSQESIEQVRDVAARARGSYNMEDIRVVERAVASWMKRHLPEGKIAKGAGSWPDFVFRPAGGGLPIGVDVMYIRFSQMFFGLRERLYRAYFDVNQKRFSSFEVVVALGEEADDVRAVNYVLGDRLEVPAGVNVTVGKVDFDDSGNATFHRLASRRSSDDLMEIPF